LDDCSLSSSSVSSVGSQRVRFFIDDVSYRAFRRPAVTTTGAVSGIIKAGQRQPRAGERRGQKRGAQKKPRERESQKHKPEKRKTGRARTETKKRNTEGEEHEKSQGNRQIQGRVRHKDIERDKKIKGGNTRTSTKETKKTSRK
jgi:hypothetical protein